MTLVLASVQRTKLAFVDVCKIRFETVSEQKQIRGGTPLLDSSGLKRGTTGLDLNWFSLYSSISCCSAASGMERSKKPSGNRKSLHDRRINER